MKTKQTNPAATADEAGSLSQIWREYQEGLAYLSGTELFTRAEKCWQMTLGDQWHGLKCGDELPPILNVLTPIMKSATSLVGQNAMAITYSPQAADEDAGAARKICDSLNAHARRVWENLKLDRHMWEVLQDAFIAGDAFLFFYDREGEIALDRVDTTNILLGDEQNPDVQAQPYLLLTQRRYVEDVRREAKENGLSEADCALIVPDDDTTGQIGGSFEVRNRTKLLSVLKLWKKDGCVYFAKATKNVVYCPARKIEGLSLYPVAQYTWKSVKGAARGAGDIWDKIPNQISINKNLYRFESAVKSSAFPHKVYRADAMNAEEVKKLAYPDSNIALTDYAGQGVDKLIAYLQPAQISSYAKDIWQDMIRLTRELAGAGDNLENVNPERASGAAIHAARQMKEQSVNMQIAAYKQFIEDIARIWYDMWAAYHPAGLPVVTVGPDGREHRETIPARELRGMRVDVRVDVSPASPYSKLAQEAGLRELFQMQAITFEEYVEALGEDASLPKAKLQDILQKRAAQTGAQAKGAPAGGKKAAGNAAEEKLIALTGALQKNGVGAAGKAGAAGIGAPGAGRAGAQAGSAPGMGGAAGMTNAPGTAGMGVSGTANAGGAFPTGSAERKLIELTNALRSGGAAPSAQAAGMKGGDADAELSGT